MIDELARGLHSRGIRKGDMVMELIPNSLDLVLSHFAIIRLGAVAVPLNVMYRHHEIEYIGKVTKAKAIISQPDLWEPLAEDVLQSLPDLQTVVTTERSVKGSLSVTDIAPTSPTSLPPIPTGLDDIVSIIFTSGTTGRPKGATQTSRSILSAVTGVVVMNKFSKNDVFLCGLPLFNNFGLNVVMMSCFSIGGTLVIIDRFDGLKVMETISQYGATYFAGTPTMFIYMLNSYDPAVHNLSTLRVTNSGGARCPQELIENVEKQFGVVHLEGYGQTEGCGYTTLNPIVGIRKPNSVGVPIYNTWIQIFDEFEKELPPNEVGEIVLKGDVFSIHGYWDNPETNEKIFRNGWYHSGDLGYLDKDGYLYVVDRKQDLIITGGYNIYPAEIEDVLYSHPKVALAAVIGVPDKVKGELATAFIVLKKGEQCSEQEIIDFARERMAKFKAPRKVNFVDSLPMGPTGKLLKKKLKEEILGRLTPSDR